MPWVGLRFVIVAFSGHSNLYYENQISGMKLQMRMSVKISDIYD